MRQGRVRHSLLVAVILLAGLASPFAGSSAAQLGRRGVDVSAIVLTAADLEEAGLEGYGVWAASPYTFDIEVDIISSSQALDEDEVEEVLDDAGFSGSYVHNYHLPSDEDDPGGVPAGTVFTKAYGFADADGAEAAYELIADESEVGFEDEPGRVRLGDEAEITLLEYEEDATYGLPYQQLELEILFDRVVLEVSLHHFELDGDIAPFADEEHELIEQLGELLIARAEAAIDGDTPGLHDRMAKLDADYTLAPYMTYYLLDGQGIPSIWEAEDVYLSRLETDEANGAISILRREQLLTPATDTAGSLVYYNLTYQFERDRDAEEFFETSMENAGGEAMEDFPELGDASYGYFQSMESDGEEWVRSQFIIQSGDLVSWVWFEQIGAGADNPEITEDAMIELGEAQAECLDRGCTDPIPVPDDLQDVIDDLE